MWGHASPPPPRRRHVPRLPGLGAPPDAVPSLRLYALDCGTLDFTDMGMFADTGEYDRKPGKMVVPCFLIRHPKGDLLWDTGLPAAIAASPEGKDFMGIRMRVARTLADQLQALGLRPADIEYVGFSHLHLDHAGNANDSPQSTLVLNRRELEWATRTPPPVGVAPETLAVFKTAKTQLVDNDLDLFGDGTVRMLRAAGHTPGHQVLMLKLERSGTVILSGDLYHSRDNRRFGRVPMHNDSRAETLASFDRVARLIKNDRARLVIQHAPEDFAALPKFPAYLE